MRIDIGCPSEGEFFHQMFVDKAKSEEALSGLGAGVYFFISAAKLWRYAELAIQGARDTSIGHNRRERYAEQALLCLANAKRCSEMANRNKALSTCPECRELVGVVPHKGTCTKRDWRPGDAC